MRFRHHGAVALLAAAALSCALPARADNYTVNDGNGAKQSFGAKLLGGVLYPIHLMYGLFGGAPTPISVDSSGNLNVNVVSGGGGGGGTLSATAHATAPSDLTEGQTNAGLVVDLSHHLFVRSTQDGAPWSFKLVDSGGGDVSDLTNHAIKVNVVAGGVGGGVMTVADGGDATLGAQADSSCSTDTGTCTLQALIKRLNASITALNTKIDTLNTNVSTGAIPAGAAHIGAVAVDAQPGAANLATAQVSVGTSATLVAAARSGRAYVTVTNGSTNDVSCGGSGVTTSTGALLVGVKGAAKTLAFSGALYCVAGATSAVTVDEAY